NNTGQFVFCKRLEKRTQHNFRKDCVPGLFKAENDLFIHLSLFQKGAFPVTLLHTVSVDNNNALYPHSSNGCDYSSQCLGPRKRQNNGYGQGRGRMAVRLYFHVEGFIIQQRYCSFADISSGNADAQAVSCRCAEHVPNMGMTTPLQAHKVPVPDKVFLKKKNKIHGWPLQYIRMMILRC